MIVTNTSPQAKAKIARRITEARKACLKPRPTLDLVEWSDTYRYLPDNSAEPGRWKTSRVEVGRQPMLSVSNPDVQEVTVMSCIQLLKTELMLNTALYFMHQEPSPIMYVAPKKETAEAWSKERLVKSVSATPVVADVFSSNRRDQGNTITQKQFPGGQISIVSARNPTDLAMRACRVMLFDEIDKYPINVGAGEGGSGGEGDPIGVAWGRATTYGRRAKKICACSPTVKKHSRIEDEYEKSNMSVFHQPCKHCGHSKELRWPDVLIPRDEETKVFDHPSAAVVCSECGAQWTEADRHWSIRHGEWVALKPEVTWHHGYKVSALASPFTPTTMLAKEFVDAQGKPESIKAFYNTRMAETWMEVGEQPDWNRLYERREHYGMETIPDGGLMLVAGVDVQKTHMYYEVVAYGARLESWSVSKGVIQGNIEADEAKVELSKFFNSTFKNSKGVSVPIMRGVVDSGYNTQEVYAFCRAYGDNGRIVPGKGDDNSRSVLGTPSQVDVLINGQRFSRGILLWKIGSSIIKEQLYRQLNLGKPTDEELTAGGKYPSGYCHFPQYDDEFFKQLTGEQFVKMTDKRGFSKYIWEKLRKDNHFLDCRVYARAAAAMLQIERMNDDDWKVYEKAYRADSMTVEERHEEVTESKPKTTKRRQGTWLKRNR